MSLPWTVVLCTVCGVRAQTTTPSPTLTRSPSPSLSPSQVVTATSASWQTIVGAVFGGFSLLVLIVWAYCYARRAAARSAASRKRIFSGASMPSALPVMRAAGQPQPSWFGGAFDGTAQNRGARAGRLPPLSHGATNVGSPFRSRDGAGDEAVSSLSPIHRLGARATSAAAVDAPSTTVPNASPSIAIDLSEKAVGSGELSDNTYSDFDDDGSDPDSLESGRNSQSASLRINPSPLSKPQELRATDDTGAASSKGLNNVGRGLSDGVAGGSILMFMSQSSGTSLKAGVANESGPVAAVGATEGGSVPGSVALGKTVTSATASPPGDVRDAHGGADSDDQGVEGGEDDAAGDAFVGADDAPIGGGYSPRESAVAYEATTHNISRDLSSDARTRVFFETMREQKRLEEEAKAAEVAAKVARMDPAERAAYEAKVAADAQYAQKKEKVITKQLTAFGSGRNVLLMGRGRGRGRGK